ncbi:MAG: type II toxin-antitoxin system prevent-host-death family antitoxin [Gammaproteobacteria bacterium]|nr:type II toxin-antitoxin system prevent-host-death family antitoxin [Gammaproteobacteria bacterium]MYC53602.1 type II toxin-antitoxin system prevent-host-death family antitoxin [Gammaproteobacteria bacterium]
MRTYNMHEAKTHLSRLVREAVEGEPFIIARAGKPLVKVTAVEDDEDGATRRLGFLAGHVTLPPDFDRMGRKQIEASFEDRS